MITLQIDQATNPVAAANSLFAEHSTQAITAYLRKVQARITLEQKKIKDSFVSKYGQLTQVKAFLDDAEHYLDALSGEQKDDSSPQEDALEEDGEDGLKELTFAELNSLIDQLQSRRQADPQEFYQSGLAEELQYRIIQLKHLKYQALDFENPESSMQALAVDYNPDQIFALVVQHHLTKLTLEEDSACLPASLKALVQLSKLTQKPLPSEKAATIHTILKQRIVKKEGDILVFHHQLFQQILGLQHQLQGICPELKGALLDMWNQFSAQTCETQLGYLDLALVVNQLKTSLTQHLSPDESARQLSRISRKSLPSALKNIVDQFQLQLQHTQQQLRFIAQTDLKYRAVESRLQLFELRPPTIQSFELAALYNRFVQLAQLPRGLVRIGKVQDLNPESGLSAVDPVKKAYLLAKRLDLTMQISLKLEGWSSAYQLPKELPRELVAVLKWLKGADL